MLFKLIGLIIMFIGLLILRYFPDIKSYQRGQMLMTGIFIGIILFLVGIAMLVFM